MIVLVTGSRSLFRYYQQIRALLAEQFRRLNPEIVVVGDASGPDTYARDVAAELGIPCAVYALDGWIYSNGSKIGLWGDNLPTGRSLPLYRNRVMAGHVMAKVNSERPGFVIGFTNPDARTHGTEHTLGLLPGIPSRVYTPRDMAA